MFKNQIMRAMDSYFVEKKKFETLIKQSTGATLYDNYAADAADFSRYVKSLQQHLINSTVFHLGEFDTLAQIKMFLNITDQHRIPADVVYTKLPYPVMLVTYTAIPEIAGDRDKRAFIVVDQSQWLDAQYDQIRSFSKDTTTEKLTYLIMPILWDVADDDGPASWTAPLVAAFPQIKNSEMVFSTYVHNVFASDEIPFYTNVLGECTAIFWYLLKLLSCKNIIVKDTNAHGKISKKRPELTYKTLHLQLPAKVYKQLNLPETIPFHEREKYGFTGQKRGHFKTYTDDAPLFGKHIGTWWWSPMFDIRKSRDYIVTV